MIALALFVAGCERNSSAEKTQIAAATNCPVVGNSKTHIYHIPGDPNYGEMVEENIGKDNRVCFQSQSEAKDAGYRRSRSGRKR